MILGMDSVEKLPSFAPFEFLLGKTLTGTVQGDIIAPVEVPRLVDRFMAGKLPIDKLVTKHFSLDEVNDAFGAIINKEVLRGVIRF